ncbi:type II toxin-antitoxin system HicA family toxin [Mucilaginibacter sp. SJ]|uniref:type II toxin-antitoxin system HicA family toxin n=1 Tax=Mucilaginibacter sp. SJ TaxID=3029053 RepID=UPI00406D24DD
MKSNELLRRIIQAGWYEVRQTGSHIIMHHKTKPGVIVYPNHGAKEVAPGLANKILKQAGLK